MSRLRLLLLFLPIAFCFDPVDIVFKPERDCVPSSSLANNTFIGAVFDSRIFRFFDAALISPIHLLVHKEAVTEKDEYDREVLKTIDDHLSVSHWIDEGSSFIIKHIIVASRHDENTGNRQFGDLAIVQLKGPITTAEAFSPICPPEPLNEPLSNVNAFFAEGPASQTEPMPHRYSKDPRYLISETGEARQFAILADGNNRLVGIGLNETTAINIRYWEEFICEHTGICMKGHRLHNWQRIPHTHYVEDNNVFKVNNCSGPAYTNLIKQSTPFKRLNSREARELRRTCGVASDDSSVPFFVTLSSELTRCHEQTCTTKSRNCTGTLISPRHVVTSADCIESMTDVSSSLMYIYYSDPEVITSQHQLTDDIKVISMSAYTRAHRTYIPLLEETDLSIVRSGGRIFHNIALVELHEQIPHNSYAKPICLSHSSDPLPDAPTLLHLTKADDVKDPSSIRFRQTRDNSRMILHNEKWRSPDNESPIVEWDYDLKRSTNLRNLKEEKDDQYIQFEFDGYPDFGSPIVHWSNGRWTLYAVTTASNVSVVKASLPSFFTTFICIHTGICEDGETFRKRTLLPYNIADPDVPPQFLRREWELKNFKQNTAWSMMIDFHEESLRNIGYNRLNRLSAEEYAKTREQCGKGPRDNYHYYTVTAGTVKAEPVYFGLASYFKWEKVCNGAFISPRHVLVSRNCSKTLLNATDYTYRYIFYGQSDDLYKREPVQIRSILIPDHFESDDVFGIGILELMNDVTPDPVNAMILCLLDYEDYAREQENDEESMYRFGKGTWWDATFKKVDLYEGLRVRKDSRTGHIVYTKDEKSPWVENEFTAMPDHEDIGTSCFRKKKEENGEYRYFLDGIISNATDISFSVLPANLMYRDMCRLTGICPKPDENRIPQDEHLPFMNGMRLCPTPIDF